MVCGMSRTWLLAVAAALAALENTVIIVRAQTPGLPQWGTGLNATTGSLSEWSRLAATIDPAWQQYFCSPQPGPGGSGGAGAEVLYSPLCQGLAALAKLQAQEEAAASAAAAAARAAQAGNGTMVWTAWMERAWTAWSTALSSAFMMRYGTALLIVLVLVFVLQQVFVLIHPTVMLGSVYTKAMQLLHGHVDEEEHARLRLPSDHHHDIFSDDEDNHEEQQQQRPKSPFPHPMLRPRSSEVVPPVVSSASATDPVTSTETALAAKIIAAGAAATETAADPLHPTFATVPRIDVDELTQDASGPEATTQSPVTKPDQEPETHSEETGSDVASSQESESPKSMPAVEETKTEHAVFPSSPGPTMEPRQDSYVFLVGVDGLPRAGKTEMVHALKRSLERDGPSPIAGSPVAAHAKHTWHVHVVSNIIEGNPKLHALCEAASLAIKDGDDNAEQLEYTKQANIVNARTQAVAAAVEAAEASKRPGDVHLVLMDGTWYGDASIMYATPFTAHPELAQQLNALHKQLGEQQFAMNFVCCVTTSVGGQTFKALKSSRRSYEKHMTKDLLRNFRGQYKALMSRIRADKASSEQFYTVDGADTGAATAQLRDLIVELYRNTVKLQSEAEL